MLLLIDLLIQLRHQRCGASAHLADAQDRLQFDRQPFVEFFPLAGYCARLGRAFCRERPKILYLRLKCPCLQRPGQTDPPGNIACLGQLCPQVLQLLELFARSVRACVRQGSLRFARKHFEAGAE